MKLRTALGVVTGLVGAAVVGPRLLSVRAGDLPNSVPGIERSYRWRGIDVRYTVAGDPDAPQVLLLHGVHAAASSQEFAGIVDQLSERYRVIAVDLPGFGRSDRPPLVYSPELYVEFVRDVIDEIGEDAIVVASSLTGAFTVEALRTGGKPIVEALDVGPAEAEGDVGDEPEGDVGDEPEGDVGDEIDATESVAHLVLVCPTAETTGSRPWLRTLFRAPVVGSVLFALLASKPSIRYFLAREGYDDAENIDEDAVEYAWRTAHQPGARYAPASFASGTLDPDIDLADALSALETPTTLVWGREASLTPLAAGRELADSADLDLVVIDHARLLPHAEHPDVFVRSLETGLQRVESGG